ncbi:MAG: radical SAM protein [Candidatus Sumerlaeia bacterium]|nr:radical SAM protein [Candidatus Sumerlaeia bacterium]
MTGKITYCLSYPLVLTRTCANRCGYCRFPLIGPERLPSMKVVRRHLRTAAQLGASQIELIAGEGLATHPDIMAMVRYLGFDSYQAYLAKILQLIEATNRRSHLFSLLNIGPLSLAELRILRPYLCAMRIMLETADPRLEFREAHCNSPGKTPDRRLEAILRCGRAGVPLTTGIIVGIGEAPESRIKAFEIIARAHERYGHIQAVRIQMFHPMPGTPMAGWSELPEEEFLDIVAAARTFFGPAMPIQVSAQEHPHLLGRLLEAGVTDFGNVSVRQGPDSALPWPNLVALMMQEARKRGRLLAKRFPLFASHCSPRWYPGGYPKRIPVARSVMLESAHRLSHTQTTSY